MLRVSTVVSIGLMLASAFVLYAVSYDARKFDQTVQVQERRADRLRSKIAVLKAERAFLSRPERIEPLARQIGMEPARGQQYVRGGQATAVGVPQLPHIH